MRTGCEPTRFGNEAKTIIHGDALAELKKLPTESVDLIFADPPYNIGKNFDGLIEAWKEDLFIDWLFEVIAECHRVLKKQGSMYIMNSTENMPFIDLQYRKLFTIKSRIVWSYDSSGVQAKKHYGSMYEPILMMVKDAKNYTFNGDAILVEAKTGSQRALIDYRKNPPQPYNHQKVPGNVWDFPRVRYLMDEYENHPTQKPEALLKRIILASSNPGDIVLDPFAGSFTTGAVAIASGRKFIGTHIMRLLISLWDVGTVFFTIYPQVFRHEKSSIYYKYIEPLSYCFSISFKILIITVYGFMKWYICKCLFCKVYLLDLSYNRNAKPMTGSNELRFNLTQIRG